jgi:hypothetical protein
MPNKEPQVQVSDARLNGCSSEAGHKDIIVAMKPVP